jgi:D-beta-D-heptose 7-phosphate kinase/D-beta-D-heptose 1-phosphate adenosyltransferase
MKQVNNIVYTDIIHSFSGKNILVIGDFILDIYLKGNSTRLSPEAPVPVVDIAARNAFPGGAANTVCNLKSLGAHVTYCTVIGTDKEGDEAIELLKNAGIDSRMIIRDPERKTITKTRIVSGTQVITRFDYGTEEDINVKTAYELICHIKRKYSRYDAIILSDYDKGAITEEIVEAITELQKRHSKFIAIDSKRLFFFRSLQVTLVKPNYEEAIKLLGLPYRFGDRAQQISLAASLFFDKINAEMIVVTLDAEGSVLLKHGQCVHHCTAPPVMLPSVAGAGDTYLSAFVLGYISSHDCKISGDLATAAASVAIKKESTSQCSYAELDAHFTVKDKQVISLDRLKELCERYHEQGKRIVFTNGCFDILHSGHVAYLQFSKELGDILIVAVNTDESIKRIKGNNRPINSLTDRLQVLSGLGAVDHILSFGDENDDTSVSLIKIIRPEIFTKGGNYTKEELPEAAIVEENGGRILFFPHVLDRSTSEIIQRISSVASTQPLSPV